MDISKQKLRKLYATNRMTANAVAKLLGVSKWTILKQLRKHGIEVRSQAESLRLRLEPTPKQLVYYKRRSKISRKLWANSSYKKMMTMRIRKAINKPGVQEKRSESLKKVWSDPIKGRKWKEALVQAHTGRKNTPEVCRKMSRAAKKRYRDPQERIRASEMAKALWKKKSYRSKTLKALRSEERIAWLRERMSGPNNTWWRGGRREPYSYQFNHYFKEQIRERDGRRCQMCEVPEIELVRSLDVHHIDENKKNLEPNNLISLCRSCHMSIRGKEDSFAEVFYQITTVVHDEKETKVEFSKVVEVLDHAKD